MKSLRFVVPVVLVLAFCYCSDTKAQAADPVPALDGWWKNQLGSVMELHYVPSTGTLSGKYRTGTATDGAYYPLTGTVNGDVFVLSVNWGKPLTAGGQVYPTVTTWVGQHTINGSNPELKTSWHLQRNTPDASENDPQTGTWDDVLTGADFFTPTTAPSP